MAEIAFKQALFKTSTGTTARSLDAWFSDVINVKEMGALGDGSTNDAAAIQAAFDLAFGSSSAPHGEDNKSLNRPVFFPAGNYKVNSTLNLTRVVGGKIYGSGPGPTRIFWGGTLSPDGEDILPILHINGAVNLCIENLEISFGGGTGPFTDENSCVLLLDWDGESGDAVAGNTGGGGLHHNRFVQLYLGGGEYIVIIADSGDEGYNNLFLNCTVAGDHASTMGIDVRGSEALNNSMIGGGVSGCGQGGIRCPAGGGSFHGQGLSMTGNGYAQTDFIIESGHICHVAQGRTESPKLAILTSGTLIIQGFTVTHGVLPLVINGGKCIVEGCHFSNAVGAPEITGSGGELYISATYFGGATTPLSGYSGTVVWNLDGH